MCVLYNINNTTYHFSHFLSVWYSNINYIHTVVQPSHYLQKFFIIPGWKFAHWLMTSYFLPSQPQVTTILLFVSMNLTVLGISYKWTIWYLSFLWLTYFTQHNVFTVHPCWRICQNLHPYLRLNDIPLYEGTTFCLSILLLLDIWLLPSFGYCK